MKSAVFPPSPVHLEAGASLGAIIKANLAQNPFYFWSIIIFALAIIHTLMAHQITHLAHVLTDKRAKAHPKGKVEHSFTIEILHFLGEVEIVFAIWVIPLLIAITSFWSWKTAVGYLNTVHFDEPLFVVVIMILASTKPILKFAEWCLQLIAKLFGSSVAAWWLIILCLCPILGSFITEPGAMTLGALLLKKQFYRHNPSKKLAYATLGLLFVNISIGGVLTNFAAPPVLMVARKWGWTNWFMFTHFGIKSLIAIAISNLIYFFAFLKELKSLTRKQDGSENEVEELVPLWITIIHILFLLGIILFLHYPILLIGLLFLFLAFHKATAPHQDQLHLRGPILVGTFLAGLVIHGSLQGWWIGPVITQLSPAPLLLASTGLTSFNDNALITYLSSLIPNLSPTLKYAIMSGAVAGGGLTVIANAPNPAGQFLLKEHFEDGVAPLSLFLGALIPTAVIVGISLLFLEIRLESFWR